LKEYSHENGDDAGKATRVQDEKVTYFHGKSRGNIHDGG